MSTVGGVRIGFSTSRAWYSRVIRWATRSRVSHTFLIVTFMGEEIILEETAVGYAMIPRFAFKDEIVASFGVTPPIDFGVRRSLQWLGQRYDYAGLVGMAFVMIGRWLGKKWNNPLASAHAQWCSEINTRVLQLAGYPGADKLDPTTTSPDDLLRFLES